LCHSALDAKSRRFVSLGFLLQFIPVEDRNDIKTSKTVLDKIKLLVIFGLSRLVEGQVGLVFSIPSK